MMAVQPFTVHVPEEALADLRERLARTRWPDELPGAAWDYGSNLAYLKELVEYWRTQFDWRAHHARLAQHLLRDVEDHPAADRPG